MTAPWGKAASGGALDGGYNDPATMKTGLTRPAFILCALAALGACATMTTARPPELSERLDERTGITVTTLDRPLEFFSPLPERGLDAASFADLGLAELNRMGTRSYYLWLSVLWGRTDPHRVDAPKVSSIALDIGGDSIVFDAARRVEPPSRLRLYAPEADWSEELSFALSIDQARAISHAGSLALEVTTSSGAEYRFTLWKPPTETLPRFADELIDGAPAPR
jgi:hypothetical protein